MNIISNCCAGGEFYKRIYKTKYNNPFIWSMLSASDLIYLIENFNNINFLKYEILPVENEDYFSIKVDNKINIIYTHYHYKNCEMTKNNVDVYYKDIKKYIIEKYNERTQRMLNNSEKPEFFIITYTKHTYDYDYEKTKKIIESLNNKDFKATIITQFYSLIKLSNDKLKIIYDKNVSKTSNNFPLFLIRDNKNNLNLSKFSF